MPCEPTPGCSERCPGSLLLGPGGRLIAWEWTSCLSPNGGASSSEPWANVTRANYEAYRAYVNGSAVAAELVVQTAGGPVRGAVEDGVSVWRGVPYAAPPGRWQPPV